MGLVSNRKQQPKWNASLARVPDSIGRSISTTSRLQRTQRPSALSYFAMVRLRSALSTHPTTQPSSPTRTALKEKTNVNRSPHDGKRGQDGKKAVRPARGRGKGKIQASDTIEGNGTVAPLEGPQIAVNQAEKSTKSPSRPATINRRPTRMTRKPVRTEAHTEIMGAMQKRMQTTAQRTSTKAMVSEDNARTAKNPVEPPSRAVSSKKPAAETSIQPHGERSEFSLSPSPSLSAQQPSDRNTHSPATQPASESRAHGTPALESSMLALKNFKRRPRQPSMLAMLQQRTTSARPSAVNAQSEEAPSLSNLNVDLDDEEDDFAPEAEGTPLHPSNPRLALAQRHLSVDASATKAPGKRTSENAHAISNATSGASPKRRKISRTEEAPKGALSTAPDPPEDEPAHSGDIQVAGSSPPSTSARPAVMQEQRQSPREEALIPSTLEERCQTDTVPLTQEDSGEPANVSTEKVLTTVSSSVVQPQRNTQGTNTESPTQAELPTQRPRAKRRVKPVNSTTLKSLLPKRRKPLGSRPRKSHYDISSSSEHEDDTFQTSGPDANLDKSAGPGRRRTRAKKTAPAPRVKSATANTRPNTSTRRSAVPPKKAQSNVRKQRQQTSTSDAENRPPDAGASSDDNGDELHEEITTSMMDVSTSTELEAARRKFAEVDEWDMEFESISVEDGRSSSQTWR